MVLLLHYCFQEDMKVKVNLQTEFFSTHNTRSSDHDVMEQYLISQSDETCSIVA
jgi:hypothetical protein